MSHPANGQLMFDRPGLDDVLVHEISANGMQEPPTDGPVASSTTPTRDPESLHNAFGDIHQPGTRQAANKGPQKQFHGTPLLTIVFLDALCSRPKGEHQAALNSKLT
jgi:hypothetical protein